MKHWTEKSGVLVIQFSTAQFVRYAHIHEIYNKWTRKLYISWLEEHKKKFWFGVPCLD